MNEFTEKLYEIRQKAEFPDLEAAVNSHLRANTLPLRVETSFARLTDATTCVNLRLVFGSEKPDIRVYVQATNLEDGTSEIYEDAFVTPGSIQALPVSPGPYHIDLAAKNLTDGTFATWEGDIRVKLPL